MVVDTITGQSLRLPKKRCGSFLLGDFQEEAQQTFSGDAVGGVGLDDLMGYFQIYAYGSN